jgi:hypothetical protein
MPDTFKNGSYNITQGVRISSQGSIYPEAYNVPCEYFFIIQIEVEPNEDMETDILMKKI